MNLDTLAYTLRVVDNIVNHNRFYTSIKTRDILENIPNLGIASYGLLTYLRTKEIAVSQTDFVLSTGNIPQKLCDI